VISMMREATTKILRIVLYVQIMMQSQDSSKDQRRMVIAK